MKGPGYKEAHDVRRTWKCPACGCERKLPGDATSVMCSCREEGTFMKIVVERTVAPRPYQEVRDHDVRSSEFGIDDMPVLQPHPSSLPPERTSPRRPRPGESNEASASQTKPERTSNAAPKEDAALKQDAAPPEPKPAPTSQPPAEEEEWGEGIL